MAHTLRPKSSSSAHFDARCRGSSTTRRMMCSPSKTGRSKVRLLWDTETEREMTPKQKLAFLMEHVEIKRDSSLLLDPQTKQLKCKLRCEVPGFEHNTVCDQA